MYIKAASYRSVDFWSKHLKDVLENDRAEIIDSRGLAADDLRQMMLEMQQDASLTRCENFMYIAIFNPCEDERLSEQEWEKAYEIFEKHRGIPEGQQRIVIEHEKKGRIHRHVVWNRIDLENMRAFPDGYDLVPCEAAEIEIEHVLGLRRTPNFLNRDPDAPELKRGPKSYEMLRGMKTGMDAREVTREVTAIFRDSQNAAEFVETMREHGYEFVKGDRAFCILDPVGNEHSLAKRIEGMKTPELRRFMKEIDLSGIPTVAEGRASFRQRKAADLQADRDTVAHEIDWESALDKAAIQREEITRTFAESDHAIDSRIAAREKRWPLHPPRPEPTKTSPGYHFDDVARETGTPEPPKRKPEKLRGVSAAIWNAYNIREWERPNGKTLHVKADRDPNRFAEELSSHGITLAAVTKEEANRSHRESVFAKEIGSFAQSYREGEIVAVSPSAHVYKINPRTTGDSRENIDQFFKKLDRTQLVGIDATKQLMHDRAEQRAAVTKLAAIENPRVRPERSGNPYQRPGRKAGAAHKGANKVKIPNVGSVIGKTVEKGLDVGLGLFESIFSAAVTPQQRAQGEAATRVRDAEGADRQEHAAHLAELAAERARKEQEHQAEQERGRGGRDR